MCLKDAGAAGYEGAWGGSTDHSTEITCGLQTQGGQ